MKTATPLLQCLALILTGNLLQAQILSSADRAKERYQQRIAAAEKIKTDGIAKLTLSYDAEVKIAQDEVKRTFEPLIRAAAMRNQTEEVRTLTLQMESIVNPDGVVLQDQDSTSPTGNDFKQLIGKWETSDSHSGYLRSFEFKSPRTVLYTYTYSTSGGGKGSQTVEWKATTKPDKIILERKDSRNYTSSYKEWYEIKIPFETDFLEITRFNESDGRNSNESFRLQRKK
jgi:hypothetical protein